MSDEPQTTADQFAEHMRQLIEASATFTFDTEDTE